ncbi:Lrp/AsnC family transcriptional regulator [Legionella longbeachae]|uniref:Putative transcriptional regulator, AsnC family n=1 Tax=Legionella longbeachae serogroup 1 (strain NSW150) TaxID=661367 RepID=D3HKH8_LEGLN|nr:Lrp/AsnC family transcriptional regulator [Legionella longbeachae]VEE03459.1 AsnC family transcriptional regulator [Legionella oakridgensis]HBD7397738.1 Lrp/AsnC family transcriptional regulator [Legionella pneumophila]ARB93646.1 Lrp/AsnC family transcriptional regulator [Legionella longbeachae]ARM33214.1 Lrp/AsnC family transcriptional regulator [Legionella longbeachae]EEZ93931.1 Bkd operon transcriptional regulator [Legionella longbeachae D-4968]
MKKNKEEEPSAETNQAIFLDKTDRKILNILQKDNQITNIALAEKVGISAPPCFRRVKRLRDAGIIVKDVSLVDPFKAGRGLIVFANITLEKQREDLLAHFERKMAEQEEVKQCYFVSGETDYLLIIHVSDMNHYNEFARRVFANEANIKMFRSSFCLNRTKYNTHIQFSED